MYSSLKPVRPLSELCGFTHEIQAVGCSQSDMQAAVGAMWLGPCAGYRAVGPACAPGELVPAAARPIRPESFNIRLNFNGKLEMKIF